MRNTVIPLFIIYLIASFVPVSAQYSSAYPFEDYDELTDTKPFDSTGKWDKLAVPTQFVWGSTDIRYPKLSIPVTSLSGQWKTKAWKGERVNAQALIWTKTGVEDATLRVSDLKSGSSVIPSSAINVHFVRYVMTDELSKDGKTGCGHRPDPTEWDSSMVADVLDLRTVREIETRTTQPVWMNIWVPADVKAGKYKGELILSGKNISDMKLPFEIEVLNRTLPAPSDWAFHLDLWQHPYSVARHHQTELWSKEHFDAMRPVMTRLKDAGQKVITATLMYKPWNGQTEDHFDSMISKTKKIDGSWTYDYTVFDTWVDFMMNDVGINGLIECYTLIPWALNFDYFDQATNRIRFIETQPGEQAYEDYWLPFLKDFSKHLKRKGWFDKTTIAMDERGVEAMKEAIKVIRKADKDFKISLAGNYHHEIQHELYDLCIAYGQAFPDNVLEERRKEGKISNVYTCCAEPFPNTFTFSPLAESGWLGWHAMAGDYDGYLRWAYNSWTKDPLRDTRFHTWAGGDCFFVYPGNRSSIRFERLIEGIQDYEKIRILKEEFRQKGDKAKLKRLDNLLSNFTEEAFRQETTEKTLQEGRRVLNTF